MIKLIRTVLEQRMLFFKNTIQNAENVPFLVSLASVTLEV